MSDKNQTHNFPQAFEERVKNDSFLGESLLTALNDNPPISIRLNSFKGITEKELSWLPFEKPITWCQDAHYLSKRPIFTLDPLFHAGCYYPQEAGSMVLDSVLNSLELPKEPVILDLCAAPGGKSTLLASFLNHRGLLVSNEVIRQRANILKENVIKWGFSNSIVTNNDPKDFERLPNIFDLIVIDAPCSGEGMFRKDPASREEWSENNVDLCSARQKRIVADVWDALKPGGYVVYSTCTFNEKENEENVAFIAEELGAEIVKFIPPLGLQKGRNDIGFYCLPNKVSTEGFYFAILKKAGEKQNSKLKFDKKKDFKKLDPKKEELQEWANIEQHDFVLWNQLVLSFPSEFSALMEHIICNTHTVKAGTTVGEIQRKGINPSEELALNPSVCCYPNRIELTKEQALQFLQGNTFPLEGKHGFQLMTFEKQPLGWIKHLGNRFNNLYPKEWRIRMRID